MCIAECGTKMYHSLLPVPNFSPTTTWSVSQLCWYKFCIADLATQFIVNFTRSPTIMDQEETYLLEWPLVSIKYLALRPGRSHSSIPLKPACHLTSTRINRHRDIQRSLWVEVWIGTCIYWIIPEREYEYLQSIAYSHILPLTRTRNDSSQSLQFHQLLPNDGPQRCLLRLFRDLTANFMESELHCDFLSIQPHPIWT
jgi:hypothetical protein